MPPDGATVICALPRTGSSLVGEIVGRNGFGYPAEWFWREDMARNKAAWGVTTFADYLERALERGTSEGLRSQDHVGLLRRGAGGASAAA